MPYEYYKDKCFLQNKDVDYDDVRHEVVTYNPYPHHYSTLNLPSWDKKEWPFSPNCVNIEQSSYNAFRDKWGGCAIDLSASTPIRPKSEHTFNLKPFSFDYKDGDYDDNFFYYGGNAPHFTHPGKGAVCISTGRLGRNKHFGFVMGNPDYPSRTRNHPKVTQPQRWIDQVFGVQFEWDAGIPFNNNYDGDHTYIPDEPNPSDGSGGKGSGGYQIRHLFITMGVVSTRGTIIDDFVLPLVRDGKIEDHVAYWYEGYSLFDPTDWRGFACVDDELYNDVEFCGVGQGRELGAPTRSGKCGFAIRPSHPNFELIANCRVPLKDRLAGECNGDRLNDEPVFKDSQFLYVPYSKTRSKRHDLTQPVNAPDDEQGEQVKVGASMIMTSQIMIFNSHGCSASSYNAFRMWNWKPITVPVDYAMKSDNSCPVHKTGDVLYQPYAPENSGDNAPVVEVRQLIEGCDVPPDKDHQLNQSDQIQIPRGFEKLLEAPRNCWNLVPYGEDMLIGGDVTKRQGEVRFTNNTLCSSWYTKWFSEQMPAASDGGKGWHEYSTEEWKRFSVKVCGASHDRVLKDGWDGKYVLDNDSETELSETKEGDYGPFSEATAPGANNPNRSGPYPGDRQWDEDSKWGVYWDDSTYKGCIQETDKNRIMYCPDDRERCESTKDHHMD